MGSSKATMAGRRMFLTIAAPGVPDIDSPTGTAVLVEWESLDGLAPDEYPDPSRCVATFHSGGGGYLCLYVDGDAARGVVWSSDEAPYLVDYSTYLDIWTNVGLGA